MNNKCIDDSELLYLRVRNIKFIPRKSNHDYIIHENGKITIRHHAFRDPAHQTSVDIASIIDYDPEITRDGDIPKYRKTNGVIGICAGDINSIKSCEKIGNRKIKVVEDKLPSNAAHAKIVAKPDFSDDKNPLDGKDISPSQRKAQFKRLRIKEAGLATTYIRNKGWCLEPKNDE